MTTTAARLYQRRRTNTQWASENPVLAVGEIGMETGGQQSPLMKMGDGVTAWNTLPYLKALLTERYTAGVAGLIGTATRSSLSSWAGILLANATTGGMSYPVSWDPHFVAGTLSWGYVPVTGGSNVRWSASITRVNALGFGDLITDSPQTTDTLTQAMGTTNQMEHVFNHPTTFNLHNSDAVLGEVVNLRIERLGGDGADTSTADCLLTNFSITWLG
jgi:hypothetical protein